jgi:hypothetical protein
MKIVSLEERIKCFDTVVEFRVLLCPPFVLCTHQRDSLFIATNFIAFSDKYKKQNFLFVI